MGRLFKQESGAALFALLAAVLYAVNTPVSKLLLREVPATVMAALLYLGAGAGVFVMSAARKLSGGRQEERPLTRRELPYTVGMVALDIAAPHPFDGGPYRHNGGKRRPAEQL